MKSQILNFSDLEKKLKSYEYEDKTVEEIKRAFLFAEKYHKDQYRSSGESYIHHPVAVVDILTDLRMDKVTLIAGFLHDVVEDTDISSKNLEEEFGKDVARLVEGVTKIGSLTFRNLRHKKSENIKKIIFAMKDDVRVIIIKIADRLHNMRTLSSLSPEKRKQKSLETLEIYAPLAARLGMNNIKMELEDLSFSHVHPEVYEDILEKAKKNRDKSKTYIGKIKKVIKDLIHDKISKGFVISGRFKNLYSIYRKMKFRQVEYGEVLDILAFRVCVETVQDCYTVLGLVHAQWTPIPGRFKDFIAAPKQNNYQSLHTTVWTEDKERIEIQIRTHEMNKIAELGIASHWSYKEGYQVEEKQKMIKKFSWLRDLVARYQTHEKTADFLDDIEKDLQEHDISIFTPLGDLRELPRGASVLDMAYSVHSELGDKVVGAKVNGRMESLKCVLKDGDVVEIITSKSQTPSANWLRHCKTSKARSRIRSYLRSVERLEAEKIGEKKFNELLKKYGIKSKLVIDHKSFADYMKEKGCPRKEDFFVQLGHEKIDTPSFLRLLEKIGNVKKEELSKDPILEKKQAEGRPTEIEVDGQKAIEVFLARCCYPLPGDDIVGFVTRGRGVVVHTSSCSKVEIMDPQRQVDVKWDKVQFSQKQNVQIRVVSVDVPGILKKISEVMSVQGVNIQKADIKTTVDGKGQYLFLIQVMDKKHLENLLSQLTKVKEVIQAHRV